MSKENKEEEGGCFSAIFFLLVVGGLIYWGYPKLKKADFVQNIMTSDTELIIGKWKVVSAESYVQGKTTKVYPQKKGDNALVGSLENPKYFIFTKENEFIRTRSDGQKIYIPFEVREHKIITDFEEKSIIELSSKKLVFKEELQTSPLPGNENLMGKIFYTYTTEKVK